MSFEIGFMEDADGVHVMCLNDDEGTLCGVYDSQYNDLKHTRKRIVTCPICAERLKLYRTVKFKEERAVATSEVKA